ncbi:tRNA(Ile)-lysidine synthase [Mesomycoplasma conjunctivae]|uniref:tRNA(Ile)-lysidine synthase n=1 Tax=Mesomycoplasma conjunctivae (strain ATCC 25834 / NCTC 10147 / HRC/581) TaxID=572263 RepID=C5J6A6_MESCH|nr:tRNA lysidine(34) synthetase TilS [Mesomycoplasma conjunctivae]CAT04998.1 tRNA(Ile)-lysidine synthase [Mesomycoplasma conjunctivae]VEU66341.1 tRNA(Ile)-lysidine synthase [Mesomycoplasma conjunctivae]
MLKKTKYRFLLAISGGADSMYLLDRFKKFDIIVAHVNYNLRKQSILEQDLVEKYCQKNNITYQILELKNIEYKSNFQSEARNLRYKFFSQVYQKYHCDYLVIAHHSDDFLETILMQKLKNKIVNFWGIKAKINNFGMQIWRPLIYKVDKNKIIKYNKKNNIAYFDDQSNFKPIYKRNQIRMDIQKWSWIYKKMFILKYILYNFVLKIKWFFIKKEIAKWKQSDYSTYLFSKLKYQTNIIYYIIHNNFEEINLTKGKINAIITFINSKNSNGSYLLKENVYLIKKKHKIILKSSKI